MKAKYVIGLILSLACMAVHAEGNFFSNLMNGLAKQADPVNEYVPPVLDGAVHLRLGHEVLTSGLYSHGESFNSCDLNYLYLAKAKVAPSDLELDECALLERWRAKTVNGVQDNRNLDDAFSRRDILAEYRPVVLNRIAELAKAERFYFRPNFMAVDPYDMSRRRFAISFTWPGGYWNLDYKIAPEVTDISTKFGKSMRGIIINDEAFASEIEAARSQGRIDRDHYLIGFVVNGTHLVRDRSTGQMKRQIEVDVKQIEILYTNPANGQRAAFGFNKYQ